MGKLFLMTDKDKTKDCQCVHPTCDNVVRVNTFYAPAKARCPEHGGKAIVRDPIGDAPEGVAEASRKFEFKELEPKLLADTPSPRYANRRLGDLHCPLCDIPMTIQAITDNLRFIAFGCHNPECGMVVELAYDWMHAQMRTVPEGLEDLVAEFNRKAALKMVAG